MKPTARLQDAIRNLYPEPITDPQAEEAARNLVGFVSLLIEIDKEQYTTPDSKGVN